MITILDHLVDAHEMKKYNPDTFDCPSYQELGDLRPGDYVKVCRYGERFWIKFETEFHHGLLVGTVANQLLLELNETICLDDTVAVECRHVYAIHPATGPSNKVVKTT